MVGCCLIHKQQPTTQIIKVSPPAFMYTDCGSTQIRELNASSTIADMLEQSLERKTELDKCIDISNALKVWSNSN